MQSSYSALLPSVTRIVQAAGSIIQDHHTKPRKISKKGRIDLVTETDVAVEEFLKQELSHLLPAATFMAEESATTRVLDSCCWIIDPVDGTTNFAHGLPLVATSVALWVDGQVVLGVVNAPLLGQCYTAVRGLGAFCNDSPIHVTSTASLEDALVGTGFPYTIGEHVDEIMTVLRAVVVQAQGIRRCGAAALDLAWLASGLYDAFYERGLQPWDMAAGWLLVEEAGGRVTLFDGQPMRLDKGEIAAGNPFVHGALQSLLIR